MDGFDSDESEDNSDSNSINWEDGKFVHKHLTRVSKDVVTREQLKFFYNKSMGE